MLFKRKTIYNTFQTVALCLLMTNNSMANSDDYVPYGSEDPRVFPGTVMPENSWWVPLEYERGHISAAQAIVKLTGTNFQGYTIEIGPKRKDMARSEFRMAATVGKMIYSAPDGSIATCTATHVGNNYVVSAGHCIPNPKTTDVCKNLKVDWNYRRSYAEFPTAPQTFTGQCKKIISWEFTAGDYRTIDHVILQVNQAPEVYIPIEPKPKLDVGDTVHQYAHPGGHKLIWIDNCKITGKPLQYFKHDCWTASGSSGAALIDTKTQNLIGILSMGSDDTFFSVRNEVSPIGCFDAARGEIRQPCNIQRPT